MTQRNRLDLRNGEPAEVPPNLFRVPEEAQPSPPPSALADLARRLQPHMAEVVLRWRADVVDGLAPELADGWTGEVAVREAGQHVGALASDDPQGAMAIVRTWAGALAAAGIPYSNLVEMLRLWERRVVELLLGLYPDGQQLRQGLAAFLDLERVYLVVAAETYSEVADARLVELREQGERVMQLLDTTRGSFMRMANRLGMAEVLPLLLAQEMVGEAGHPGIIEARGGRFVHTGPHFCGLSCTGDIDGCLTAYLAQVATENTQGEAMRVLGVELLPSGECRVTLAPVVGHDPKVL